MTEAQIGGIIELTSKDPNFESLFHLFQGNLHHQKITVEFRISHVIIIILIQKDSAKDLKYLQCPGSPNL